MNRSTGEWFWDACRATRCWVCGPKKAWATGGAIAVVEPERFVRFSLVGDAEADWQSVRARMFRVRYDVRQEFPGWEDCYSVEPNPRGTGYHAHLFQHGPYVPQQRLQAICERRALGIPDIRRWRSRAGLGASYGLKEATGYGLKGAERSESLARYLSSNGGRLLHASRGFWRDRAAGGRLAGVGAARRVYLDRRFGRRERFSMAEWKLEQAA